MRERACTAKGQKKREPLRLRGTERGASDRQTRTNFDEYTELPTHISGCNGLPCGLRYKEPDGHHPPRKSWLECALAHRVGAENEGIDSKYADLPQAEIRCSPSRRTLAKPKSATLTNRPPGCGVCARESGCDCKRCPHIWCTHTYPGRATMCHSSA